MLLNQPGYLAPDNDNANEVGFHHPAATVYVLQAKDNKMMLVKAHPVLVQLADGTAYFVLGAEPVSMKAPVIPGHLFVPPFGKQNAPHQDPEEEAVRARPASAPHAGDSEDGRVLSLSARAPKASSIEVTNRRGNPSVSSVADIGALKRLREKRLQKGSTGSQVEEGVRGDRSDDR